MFSAFLATFAHRCSSLCQHSHPGAAGSHSLSSPILPLTQSSHSSLSQREDSKPHPFRISAFNEDEPAPLSKQLLSDSVRLEQAPRVTQFSHLPKEINKQAVLPCEDVPPASSTVRTFRRNPREVIVGTGTEDFPRLSPALTCPGDRPSGHSSCDGRVAPRPLPSLEYILVTGQVLNLSAPQFPHL